MKRALKLVDPTAQKNIISLICDFCLENEIKRPQSGNYITKKLFKDLDVCKIILTLQGEGVSKLLQKSKRVKWESRMRYFINKRLKEINSEMTVKKRQYFRQPVSGAAHGRPILIRNDTLNVGTINVSTDAALNNRKEPTFLIGKFQNVCRVCENRNNTLVNIFENEPILIKMKACTSIKLNKDDNLPKFICPKCEFNLEAAYSFKIQCEQTDRRLRLTRKTYSHVLALQKVSSEVFHPKVEESDSSEE